MDITSILLARYYLAMLTMNPHGTCGCSNIVLWILRHRGTLTLLTMKTHETCVCSKISVMDITSWNLSDAREHK